MSISRRAFFGRLAWATFPLAAVVPRQQGTGAAAGKPAPPAGRAPADTLAIPLGRNTAALTPLDNDPTIIAIERRLRCTCGCTLDVYTCRTTDFACTFSPAMHADVVSQFKDGATADQIVQAFVAKDGETVLMAPAPRGFNLMGYVVPGLTVTAFGLVLAAWLVRKRPEGQLPTSADPGVAPPDAEQLEKLRRALDDVES